MDRTAVLDALRKHKPVLMQRFGVVRLSLFGSVSRNSSTAGSDVDVLVGFDGPATSDRYFGLLFYLEDLLGGTIDLVTDKALRSELRPFVEKEALDV